MRIVLLPGMDGSGSLFADFIRALPADIKATVVSYPPDQALSYKELEEVARSHLPSDEPFVLLGESFSGPIAVSLAATHPAGLLGLVLVCSFVRSPIPIPAMLRPLLSSVPVRLVPIRAAAAVLLGRLSSEPARAALAASISLVHSNAWKARLRSVMDVDFTAKAEGLRIPVLYVRATHDRVVAPSAGVYIARLASEIKVVNIKGPHFVLQAKPIEAATHIGAFVREACLSSDRSLLPAGRGSGVSVG